ncbi:hypothetical protein SAMN04488543_1615 [Friedmanniella luteola]|uniref:Uncharacterized protein n=1 Tax=Friedmanniella luteola TaxID=546871 RepID=A0A1H1RPQ7_9ACTN|nr:choice-of-anchor P family protein [Friedmanniella luteola]SDS37695.1 hypothetical protein SAMN04488543_1615 [Friedmanniella luteola]
MSHPRRLGAAALAAAAVTLTTALPAQAATFNAFGGSAYASTAKVGTLVNSDKTSYVPLCTLKAPTSATDNTAKLSLGLVGSVGAATTKVSSAKTTSTKTSLTTTKVATTSLLTGLVQARAITSTATVKRTSTGYTRSGASVFSGLKIGGRTITATPKPNTKVELPGVATVLLNAQSSSYSSGGHNAATTALKVTLLPGNRLGLPVGTVVVGVSNASLHTTTHARPYGTAFGTQLDAAGIVGSGRTAAVHLPCGGTSGKSRTNGVASVHVPGLLEVGAVKSTGRSTDTSTSTVAATTAALARVDLLNGVVTLDSVDVTATATRKGKAVVTSSSGTEVAGLKINGRAVSVSGKENTKINIAGVGTLHLRRVVKSAISTTVYGAQLVLSTDKAGLKKGTTLTVGYAKAGVSAS